MYLYIYVADYGVWHWVNQGNEMLFEGSSRNNLKTSDVTLGVYKNPEINDKVENVEAQSRGMRHLHSRLWGSDVAPIYGIQIKMMLRNCCPLNLSEI